MKASQRVRGRSLHRVFCLLFSLTVLALGVGRMLSSGGLATLAAELGAAGGAAEKLLAFCQNTGVFSLLKMGVSFLFLLIPPVLCRLFRAKPAYGMNIAIYLFCFAAYSLGVAMEWYHRIGIYDLIAHFLSGVFFALIGMCAWLFLRRDRTGPLDADPRQTAAFSFLFAGFVAGFWELLEYASFLITGYDSQNVAATGVADTMEDMLMGMLGGLLTAVVFLVWSRWHHRSILLAPVREFYRVNFAPDMQG
ncbi:MAG: hypothetical protein HFJ80_01565 [Clostridiales bacterium]|nr:hypothetical protein [Clostridiales bacterium]